MKRLAAVLTLATILPLMPCSSCAQRPEPGSVIPHNPEIHRPKSPPGPATVPVTSLSVSQANLIDSSTGWAVNPGDVIGGSRLLWTADAGSHWKDISPPNPHHDSYADVFFLDRVTGWVLFSHEVEAPDDQVPHPDEGDWTFYIAGTQDGGASWTTTYLPALKTKRATELTGTGQVLFSDRQSGWLEVHRSLISGGLLHSVDGGATWEWVANAPDISASVVSRSSESVYLVGAGGPDGGSYFYASHDGGGSFNQISLVAPSNSRKAVEPTYGLPLLGDDGILYEPVTYSAETDEPSLAALFASRDGGRKWTLERTLSGISPLSVGSQITSAISDSNWIIPFAADSQPPTLLKIGPGMKTTAPTNHAGDLSLCKLSVPTLAVEWSLCSGHLFRTDDGGHTWNSVNPRVQGNQLTARPLTSTSRFTIQTQRIETSNGPSQLMISPLATSSGIPSGLDQRMGFEITRVPTRAQMQTWWNTSPYYDVGIYLPTSPNRGTDKRLTPDWISAVMKQGWGLMPIWFGLQASCVVTKGPITEFIPANADDANAAGQTQAVNAHAAAIALGLDGSIIYLDMENYASPCSSVVQAYISGFVQQWHSYGGQVGVYGAIWDAADINNPCYNNSCSPPDALWLPRADYRVTVWNLDHGLKQKGVSLPDTYWPTRQRIHQYATDVTDTWGGVNLSIDRDIVDATIIPSGGLKPYSAASFTPSSYGSNGSWLTAMSNSTGQQTVTYPATALGYFWEASGQSDFDSFFWSPSTGSSLFTYSGMYGTSALGMNSEGDIVGYYWSYPLRDLVPLSTAFLWNNKSKGFVKVNIPGASQEYADSIFIAINDAGWILAQFRDDDGNTHLSILKPVNGSYLNPTSVNADLDLGGAAGINGIGEIAGYWNTGEADIPFIDDVEAGSPLDPSDDYRQLPSPTGTTAVTSINNNAVVAGFDSVGGVLVDGPQYNDLAAGYCISFVGINDAVELAANNCNETNEGYVVEIPH